VALAAEAVGDLNKAVVDARVGVRRVVVRDVMVAIFGADGSGLGAEKLDSNAEVEGEVEGTGIVDWDWLGGIHVSAMADEEGLGFVLGTQIELKPGGGHGLSHDPAAALAGDGGGRTIVGVCRLIGIGILDDGGRASDGGTDFVCVGGGVRQGLGDDIDAFGIAFKHDRQELGVVLEVDGSIEQEAPAVGDAELKQPAVFRAAEQHVAGISRVCAEDAEGVLPGVIRAAFRGLSRGDRRAHAEHQKHSH